MFLPAAFIIALNPVSSFAFAAWNHWNDQASLLHLAPFDNFFLDRRSYAGSSPLTSSLSASEDASSPTHQGSSAVRSMKPQPTDATKLQLLSFYRFIPISHPETIRDDLFERLKTIEGLRGTVYVASEGINAQFAVPVGEPLNELLHTFGKDGGCLPFDTFEYNTANMGNVVGSNIPTFDKLIVRTRNYILRDGMKAQLDWNDVGIELDPNEWDAQLREQPNIQLLDCRNSYESDQGTFNKARPLNTASFSDTWSVLDSQVEANDIDPSEPVYIFCTGGIRCVKVGAYLKQKLGVEDVRSLRHGIIGYERWNEEANKDVGIDQEEDSLWVGENFLFDKRRFAKGDDRSEA